MVDLDKINDPFIGPVIPAAIANSRPEIEDTWNAILQITGAASAHWPRRQNISAVSSAATVFIRIFFHARDASVRIALYRGSDLSGSPALPSLCGPRDQATCEGATLIAQVGRPQH